MDNCWSTVTTFTKVNSVNQNFFRKCFLLSLQGCSRYSEHTRSWYHVWANDWMSRLSIWCSRIFGFIPRTIHPWRTHTYTHTHQFALIITEVSHAKWIEAYCTSSCGVGHIVLVPSLTTPYCKWATITLSLSVDCSAYAQRALFTVQHSIFKILVDSCKSDYGAAPPKPRKVWITLRRTSKLTQWVVGTHTCSKLRLLWLRRESWASAFSA